MHAQLRSAKLRVHVYDERAASGHRIVHDPQADVLPLPDREPAERPGAIHPNTRRRLLLLRSRYHLVYSVDDATRTVRIRTIRASVRVRTRTTRR
jgi:hypothetical protein